MYCHNHFVNFLIIFAFSAMMMVTNYKSQTIANCWTLGAVPQSPISFQGPFLNEVDFWRPLPHILHFGIIIRGFQTVDKYRTASISLICPVIEIEILTLAPYPLYKLRTSFMNGPSASKLCSHITMADYLTSNRDEVERFKTNAEDAFEWQHYFDFVSDLEPNTPIEDIMHRTRNAIKVGTW